MKHLGDITKISGYTAPIVDCVIGGSPCQDLSVAGKRAGLEGERSGLFMEQIRIVKEMRKQDERNGRTDVNIRPRYMVWENVPGAFSSNKGEDFRVVLEEIAKVKDENASIPMPKDGKWTTSGSIVGDGWSIAWRVLDAQFWGVPQRRRRIALVADFGGESSSEILFVSKSLPGHLDESKQKREDSTSDATGGTGADDSSKCVTFEPGIASREGGHVYENVSGTLRANAGDNQMSTAYTMQDREGKDGGGKGALNGFDTGDVRTNKCVVFKADDGSTGKVVPTIVGDHNNRVTDHTALVVQEDKPIYAIDQGGGESSANVTEGKTPTLTCTHGGEPVVSYQGKECYTITCGGFTQIEKDLAPTCMARDYKDPNCVAYAVDCRNGTESEVNGALQSNSAHSLNGNNTVRTRYIVRRLTPLECERLQGYPDGWTDIGEYIDSNGKKRQTSDAARYKALGNSIALPPWKWVLKRICACYERDATMASLFDGIGGFPLIWEQLNGKGTCLWASEIEEFPMAVTKVRIGE